MKRSAKGYNGTTAMSRQSPDVTGFARLTHAAVNPDFLLFVSDMMDLFGYCKPEVYHLYQLCSEIGVDASELSETS
jgi:hypothetical protein